MQGSGSAIDRVFNTPVAPVRRFRGAIDATLTLALGSVCAFALTLGPAPLNTVALASSPAPALSGGFDPSPTAPLTPADVEVDEPADEHATATTEPAPNADAPVEASTEPPAPAEPPVASTKGDQAPKPEKAAKSGTPPKAHTPSKPQGPSTAQKPQKPKTSGSPALISASAALTVVDSYRQASGLPAFVSPDDCALSTEYASVKVTPSLLLPPGLAKKTLAADPAYATVAGGPGALTVTIHACR